jgi:hypothetical protein
MSIPIDNSTQLPQTAFTSGAPDFANVNEWSKIGSNIYNTSLGNIGIGTTNPNGYKLNVNGSLNSSSLYQNGTQIDFSSYATNTALTNGLATKQNTLTAFTNLVGIGSSINDIDYNKITINKPTTFPAIMTDIYNKTETNNLLNAKQNTLTAATTLLGTGGSITGINFNTITNKPTYTSPLSSNVSTNVISVDLSSKQNTLTAATTLLGTGGSITGINFNTIINKPTYTAPLSSNLLTNVISVDLSSYATNTALTNGLAAKQDTLTAATTLLGTGGSITGINFNTITNKPTYTSPLSSNVSTNVISVDLSSKQNTLTASTVLAGIGSNLTLINYATLSNLPTTFPANMTDIYTKTETNNLLNAKEAILTFSSPIIRTVNTISLNQSLIDFNNLTNKPDMNLYLLKSGGTMTGNLTISKSAPLLTLKGSGGLGSISQINLSTYDEGANQSSCSILATDNGNFGATFQINQKTSGAITNTQFTSLFINASGNVGIGTNNPGTNKLNVIGNTSINGLLNVHNGFPNGNVNMQAGSLAIGGTNVNYGGVFYPMGNWTGTNTAGILMECLNNTEIVVHDFGNKLNSLMYYEGGTTNSITIGRDMGWYGISSVNLPTSSLYVANNVGIGITNPSTKLYVNGNTTINGNLILKNDTWHTSIDGIYRFYFAPNNTTYICSGGAAGDNGLVVYSSAASGGYNTNLAITNSGNATIRNNLTVNGALSGANNVCKRSSFTFTPTLVNVIGIGLRYTQTINLSNYMNSVNYGFGVQYTFRIHIWTSTGDYYDSINNVESIGFYVHLSRFGVDGKIRINTIYNNSNGSTIGFNSFNSIFYNGWNGTGGASTKVCVIENISSF